MSVYEGDGTSTLLNAFSGSIYNQPLGFYDTKTIRFTSDATGTSTGFTFRLKMYVPRMSHRLTNVVVASHGNPKVKCLQMASVLEEHINPTQMAHAYSALKMRAAIPHPLLAILVSL